MVETSDVSWWPSLHDADLVRFTSDCSARTAAMDVRIEHLGDGAGIGAAFSFVFQLVRAIHMARWEHWSFPERPASDSELMGRRDWGRVVSVNTHDLKGPNLRIHDANLHSTTAAALPWPLLNCPSDTPVQLLT